MAEELSDKRKCECDMLDSLREWLNRVPPAVSCTVAVVVLLAAGVFTYMQLSPSSSTGFVVPAEGTTTIRCRHCGATFKESTAELVRKKYLDPVEHVYLIGEGRKCPKCGEYTMSVIEQETSDTSGVSSP